MERISIEYTGQEAVLNAYRDLPKPGELAVRAPIPELKVCLEAIEAAGFCGIFVSLPEPGGEVAVVSAYKAKQGPCYDTGRKAVYRGTAKAVLDDDNHLLIAGGELPVCEKTATVYALPPYQGRVDVSPPVPELSDRFATDPVVFDCDTFDEDMAGLYDMFADTVPDEERCILYYPGPFRFLILEDGSVVRRGMVNNVPASLKETLLQQEGFADAGRMGPTAAGQKATTGLLIFKDMYRKSGPAFFLYPTSGTLATENTAGENDFLSSADHTAGKTEGTTGEVHARSSADEMAGTRAGTTAGTRAGTTAGTRAGTTAGTRNPQIAAGGKADFSVLEELSTGLKERLAGVIRDNRKYFILTGSDPDIEWGCCPSEEVSEAGILVRAGILSSYAQPVPEDACPLTTYAFRSEMQVTGDGLRFNTDPEFRKKVLQHIEGKHVFRAGNLLKWVLLVFVLASIGLTIYRLADRATVPNGITLYEQLSPVSQDQFMVVLFHFRERCETCLNMEKYTRDFLESYNQGRDRDSQIQFRLEVINDDRNVNLVRRFNLYTSTLVLVKFENGREEQVRVLSDAWQLYRDEEAYKAMLANEIMSFTQQFHG